MIRITVKLCLVVAFPIICLSSSVNARTQPIDSADFYLQKGLVEKENGRKLESLKNFEKAAKYDGNNKLITAELASAYHSLRKYGNAREMYKKLVSLGEETPEVYRQLLQLSFQMKQNEDVIVYANKLKSLVPSEKVSYYIGKVNYNTENYGEALKHLNKAAKEDPENAEVPYMIARSYADMMNYKASISYFLKAIELDPKQNYWVYELGLIYYAMNDDKNALKYILEAANQGYKKDNDYLENLAIAYLNVGQLDSGVTMLNTILERRPSDLNILNMIAEAYYYKSKFDKAIEYWDRVLEYDKENASSLYMIGMCYQKKGGKVNNEKGIKLCDKAIELDPTLANLKQKKMMAGM